MGTQDVYSRIERFNKSPIARATIRLQAIVAVFVVPILLGLVGVYFSAILFGSLAYDTTRISNSAFAIMIALAALSFGWARALDEGDPRRMLIRYAGENLAEASLKVICASLLKYVALASGSAERYVGGWLLDRIKLNGVFLETVDAVLSWLVFLLFVLGILSATVGVMSLGVAADTRVFRVVEGEDPPL